MSGGGNGRAGGGRGVEGVVGVLERTDAFIVQHIRSIEAGAVRGKSIMVNRDGIVVLICSDECGICCAGLESLLLEGF